ncbi:hypothetical protein M5U04_06990 [Xenorhabdus sp. XENO-1]|uniref:damage-inducible type I toxin DinQ n=1 Tax=Xenorhabdus bovienii TaxID=40576 RepID=UPI0020CA446A|nr:hypothetical protein [Xenorhabdus bovienii subsp. africana]
MPRSERDILNVNADKSQPDRQRKGNGWLSRAPNYRSKRMKAFIDNAIIVLKALVAFLELIRTFLK